MRWLALVVALLLTIAPADRAAAHALQPGYLELTHIGGQSWRVFWRVPDVRGRPMAIAARLPDGCDPAESPAVRPDTQAWSTVWVATCTQGLRGGDIAIPGLEATRTDVLVRYELADGTALSERLTPDRPAFTVPPDPGALDVLRTYLPLGVEHILGGIDHLLFVFALLLLIPDKWRLLGAITSFTVAHSITMAAATLGWVTLPGPPVEAVIALSIMFVASELLRRGDGELRTSERYPWIVSFAFGLLHGFGFAGALAEIGLPQTDVPLALLAFNLGVEIGQLMFVAGVLVLVLVLRRIVPRAVVAFQTPGTAPATILAYGIGTAATFWMVERVTGFLA